MPTIKTSNGTKDVTIKVSDDGRTVELHVTYTDGRSIVITATGCGSSPLRAAEELGAAHPELRDALFGEGTHRAHDRTLVDLALGPMARARCRRPRITATPAPKRRR